MRKIIIAILLFAISIGGVGVSQLTKISDSEQEKNTVTEVKNKSEQIDKAVNEDKQQEVVNSNREIKKEDKSSDKKTKNNSSKSQNNPTNSTSETKQEASQSISKVEEQPIVQETPKEEQPIVQETPKEEEPKQEEQKPSYIGVPDPNDLDYPVHHGVIQYKTYEECYNAGIELSFADSNVKSFWSYPVRDSQATVLGYYLYVERY